ncbi:MAG: hypothetical protein IPJ42_21800 [Betaproteobacteria bacterium]|nr:hypothetical protein [Betaproteobacteria bacterium]
MAARQRGRHGSGANRVRPAGRRCARRPRLQARAGRQRERLRPGAGQRRHFRIAGRQHFRRAADLRFPGAADEAEAAHRRGAARGQRDHTHFRDPAAARHPLPDDPAFKGQPRELTAADYVYSIKRYYDPATRSPTLFHYQNAGLLGLSELRTKAIETQTPFPYDQEVEGLRVVDRYTFEIRTARPAPRLPYVLATPALAGAVAREVVDANPARAMEHPVGTGPYRLADWKRRSRIVLERNPLYDGVYDEQPAAGDAQGAAIAERFRGRALPMLDRVEISIIEESQPRWLAFLNAEIDLVAVPADFNAQVAPGGRIAPNLVKQGIVLHRAVQPLTYYTYFGMEDPVLGGYQPHRVALRAARWRWPTTRRAKTRSCARAS